LERCAFDGAASGEPPSFGAAPPATPYLDGGDGGGDGCGDAAADAGARVLLVAELGRTRLEDTILKEPAGPGSLGRWTRLRNLRREPLRCEEPAPRNTPSEPLCDPQRCDDSLDWNFFSLPCASIA
jgi:hypothetical protein